MTAALLPLQSLDSLWFQVTGTLCNLTCTHCFISCSPRNRAFGFLTLETVRAYLEESRRYGVKEYYFTGGEPFLHKDIVEMLAATLEYGPVTVLTNGMLLKSEQVKRLANSEAHSLYSLEFRVSLDGFTAETNDPIRGAGSFARAMAGVQYLLRHEFLPIITAVQTWSDEEGEKIYQGFVRRLKELGYTRPRIKLLPLLHIGAEVARTRGYLEEERVSEEMLVDYDTSQLLCASSRIVTDRGVHVCPILIDEPGSRLGQTLAESLGAYPLRHQACYTCYLHGAICSNVTVRE
jgi:AdoMet-dependent heme synthase